MRGILAFGGMQAVDFGIIPAHAGNTNEIVYILQRNRDHPRACGEYTIPAQTHGMHTGSSPRMRGILQGIRGQQSWLRIIPAHAGNTRKNKFIVCGDWDHPRACGEYHDSFVPVMPKAGSSPRMRGILFATEVLIIW